MTIDPTPGWRRRATRARGATALAAHRGERIVGDEAAMGDRPRVHPISKCESRSSAIRRRGIHPDEVPDAGRAGLSAPINSA
ncbi:hypothetical protein GCM10023322_68820 [Rugosimonospora acidiphila]|uniref:Uncharacterized protein n=1 Tax=Rugosimonospora acidiphila TaxID=556531 RepID=A0ABP9SLK4_9ACTN